MARRLRYGPFVGYSKRESVLLCGLPEPWPEQTKTSPRRTSKFHVVHRPCFWTTPEVLEDLVSPRTEIRSRRVADRQRTIVIAFGDGHICLIDHVRPALRKIAANLFFVSFFSATFIIARYYSHLRVAQRKCRWTARKTLLLLQRSFCCHPNTPAIRQMERVTCAISNRSPCAIK